MAPVTRVLTGEGRACQRPPDRCGPKLMRLLGTAGKGGTEAVAVWAEFRGNELRAEKTYKGKRVRFRMVPHEFVTRRDGHPEDPVLLIEDRKGGTLTAVVSRKDAEKVTRGKPSVLEGEFRSWSPADRNVTMDKCQAVG